MGSRRAQALGGKTPARPSRRGAARRRDAANAATRRARAPARRAPFSPNRPRLLPTRNARTPMSRLLLFVVATLLLGAVVFCIGVRAGYGEPPVLAFCAFACVLYFGILFGRGRIAAL